MIEFELEQRGAWQQVVTRPPPSSQTCSSETSETVNSRPDCRIFLDGGRWTGSRIRGGIKLITVDRLCWSG